MVRDDMGDLVYLTQKEKYQAIVDDIRDCVKRGQPALVGTASIETSELIADTVAEGKIPHEVLNAKQHEREAGIVAQAGRPGSVTIATNMAGRGTDIVLGGNLEAELEESGDPVREAAFARSGKSAMPRSSRPAVCTSWAPSDTSPGASTTSCAAAPVARVTRAPAAFTSPSKTT